jgi:RNA polymerase sigma-70 factor, ECF subfamily
MSGTVIEVPVAESLDRGAPGLIAQVLAGHADAFLELLGPHERSMYLVAYSVVRNQADAEDVVQEATLKAFEHLAQLRSDASFRSWLFRITLNEARLKLRKNRAHLYESLDEGIEDADEGEIMPRQVADWREIPSEILERREIREKLKQALLELPEKYRMAFVLRDMQQLSEAEAAQVLGITAAAVKVRLHRARLQLREKLAPIFQKRWKDRLPFRKGAKPW